MAEILVPQPHHWLGLCLVTESNVRKEWPLIAQVIYNRVASKRYPDTLEDVILQRSQFSAFNPWTGLPRSRGFVWDGVGRAVCRAAGGSLLLAYAIDSAALMENLMTDQEAEVRRVSFDISPDTYHYWSPVSMATKGKRPAWAPSASRLYTPEGIDPQRFVFAENVP